MSESGLYEQVRSLADNQAEHHTRVYRELEELRLSNLSVHNVAARVEERHLALIGRLDVMIAHLESKLDDYATRLEEQAREAATHVARVEALERIEAKRVARVELAKQVAGLAAWAIGVAATLISIVAAVAAKWGQ